MIHGIDLFCGVGGLTHGLIRGGIRIVAGIDLDPQCRYPYEANNAATFIERDVRVVTGQELRQLMSGAKYTLLAGCAPCQPFSTYSRKGRKRQPDLKWDLVADFAQLVRRSDPDFVTMENVPQLTDHRVFKEFLSALKDYNTWWKIVECAEYGIPQTRKRLVLLASRFGHVTLKQPAVGNECDATVREAIAELPALEAGESDAADALHSACSLSELNLRRIKASKPGGTWRDWDRSLRAKCHRKKTGKTYPSVYGRMQWDSPAPTITTQCFGYGNGRFGHPEQHRAISLREAALLQTFPRSYRFLRECESPRFSVLGRLIGNAVPVTLGEHIADAFRQHAAEIDLT